MFFADRGYGPATNNLIAEAAGVTSGALYYHFGSKGELFAAVCDDSFESIYQRYASEITEPLDMRGLLHQLLAVSMKLNREQPSLAGFVATAPLEARRYPELAGAVARHVERRDAVLADLIRAGQQARVIRADVDAVRAGALIGVLLHGFSDSAAQVTADELEAQVELFMQLIEGGLAP